MMRRRSLGETSHPSSARSGGDALFMEEAEGMLMLLKSPGKG